MRINVIKAYIFKEFKELLRSKMIFMVYLMPSMILILFGYGIRMEVVGARVIIIDNDKSKLSYELINKFEHSKYFETKVENISEKEALNRIKRAQTDILVIIPSSFEKKVLKKQKSEIGIFIDGAFPIRAMTMQSYATGVILDAANRLAEKYGVQGSFIEIEQRSLFNQAMRDENAIIPGVFGIVLLVAPAILSALLIVREKERGTIFNFYSSPIKKDEFLIAKLTPPFLLHSLNIFILLLISLYLFKVPFRGSFFLYFVASQLYIVISLSIGLLVSIITNRQIVAVVLVIMITIIPGFLYSGMLMPISSMEGESYIEAHLFPVMYYNHILYDVFLIGEGLKSFKTSFYLFILFVYGAALLAIGVFALKKELR